MKKEREQKKKQRKKKKNVRNVWIERNRDIKLKTKTWKEGKILNERKK